MTKTVRATPAAAGHGPRMSDQLGGLINSKHTHTPGRDQELRFNPPPTPIRAEITFALRYGHAHTPLALVVPDLDWPGMWQIAWPDGRFSDLVNLPRAKDAAEAISERGPPAHNRRLFHWHTSKTPRGAAPVAQTGTALPGQPSSENNASLTGRAVSSSSSPPSAGGATWR